jgi:hypothetical protein
MPTHVITLPDDKGPEIDIRARLLPLRVPSERTKSRRRSVARSPRSPSVASKAANAATDSCGAVAAKRPVRGATLRRRGFTARALIARRASRRAHFGLRERKSTRPSSTLADALPGGHDPREPQAEVARAGRARRAMSARGSTANESGEARPAARGRPSAATLLLTHQRARRNDHRLLRRHRDRIEIRRAAQEAGTVEDHLVEAVTAPDADTLPALEMRAGGVSKACGRNVHCS